MIQTRKIQNSLEIERIIGIDMNMKQRFFPIMEKLLIEVFVILICALRRKLLPKRIHIIYRFRSLVILISTFVAALIMLMFLFVLFFFLKLFGGFYIFKINLYRHKRTVFFEYLTNFVFLKIFLLSLCNMHNYVGSAFCFFRSFHFVFTGVSTAPHYRGLSGIGFSNDIDR